MFDGVEIPLIAGQLISAKQPPAGPGANIQLNHAMRVGIAVSLALDRNTDEQSGPGVVRRRQGMIQDKIGHVSEVRDCSGITGISIVVHHPVEDTGGTLAKIAIGPIAGVSRSYNAIAVNVPSPAENIMRIGGDCIAGRGPWI